MPTQIHGPRPHCMMQLLGERDVYIPHQGRAIRMPLTAPPCCETGHWVEVSSALWC